jgi:hypothetical protein
MANLGRKVVFAFIVLALLGFLIGLGQATITMFTLRFDTIQACWKKR